MLAVCFLGIYGRHQWRFFKKKLRYFKIYFK